jgi:hypothetical protein
VRVILFALLAILFGLGCLVLGFLTLCCARAAIHVAKAGGHR